MSRNQNFNDVENNTCVVCFKNVDIFSIGDCDHAVCFECSTRMRVLCVQNECPICRRDMPKVIFTKVIQPFKNLKTKAFSSNLLDKRFGIHFTTADIQDAYQRLLEHSCQICKNEIEPFRTFHQLKEHMRRQHEVFSCDLCVDNLKIFSFERRFYTRTQLAMHRRKGDPDDKSHKGHPLCEFCETRYMDSDELYRHLRRDHLYCHFCDADGKHHYYSSYDYLRQHFQNEHFLCVEGDCKNEQFTSVFRSDIDLKAHKASIHGRELGKVGAKQARTLELEFRLAPRPRSNGEQMAQLSRHRVPPPQTLGQHLGKGALLDSENEDGAVGYEKNEEDNKQINALDPELFPSLGGMATVLPTAAPMTRSSGNGITIRHTRNTKGLARTEENFPALSADAAPIMPTGGSTVRFSVNTSTSNATTKGPNVSIHVNHRPSVTSVTPRASVPTPEAFPTLGGKSSPIQPAKWVPVTPKTKKTPTPAPSPSPKPPKNFTNKKDFPTLTKSSKSTSINIPVSNSWSSEESSSKSAPLDQNAKKKTKKKGAATNDTKELLKEVQKISNKVVETKPEKERKKTELNIGNLKTPPPAINGTNFPVLGSSRKPPGFDSWPAMQPPKNPPPGFKQPPPGFNSIDLIAAHSAADLTFTNSSGEKYSILPNENNNFTYHSPANFQQRNKKLVQNFMTALSDTDLNEFRQLSHLFKQGSYSAQSYYDYCKKCLGQQFEVIFAELLALLPDIQKQKELFDIYKMHNGGKKCKKQLDVCAVCGQVVVVNDLRQHVLNHSLDNHFPVLGGAGASQISTTWKK